MKETITGVDDDDEDDDNNNNNNKRVQHWVYLMTLNEEGVAEMKHQGRAWSSHIGLASNPIKRLKQQNREPGYDYGRKTTSIGAPYWQLELCIFGIPSKLVALFRDDWKLKSRKVERRIVYGIHKAIELRDSGYPGIEIYARDEQLTKKLLETLPTVIKSEATTTPTASTVTT